MGSITLTKAKGIWRTLPAPLRGAVTLLAVLALAALLTTVRHNASAYLTGVWDTGSQTLVYGRIHQMEQGQHAPGGFLGVYTDDWSDDTNRALFRDDTPADAAAFRPYTHQSGLQGWLFGRPGEIGSDFDHDAAGVLLVEERCRAGSEGAHTNRFWADAATGAVLRAEQWVGPGLPPMTVEFAASAD